MIKTLSNLLTRAGTIKNELTDLANSALRVGGWMEDESKASIKKYDPAQPYEAGQTAVKDGVLIECVADAGAGETPTTHPLKWSVPLVTDEEQVNESNHLPIAASAVHAYVEGKLVEGDTPPNATTGARGLARQASDVEFATGTNNDAFTTPKQVNGLYKTIIDGIQAITGISLDKALQGGADSNVTPYFDGGIVATLPGVPDGVATKPVVVATDGTLYAQGAPVITPPTEVVYSFSGGVHYEAVPVATTPQTRPVLNTPTADWLITQRGVSEKVLEADEFTFNPTETYFHQAWKYDGSDGSLSNLPPWLTLVAVSPTNRKLVANITADVQDTAFPVRIIMADASGSADVDDFLLTLRIPVANACPNYFALTDVQLNALPIVQVQEYYDAAISMGTGLSYTVRAFASRAEALANIGNGGGKARLDFNRATSAACNIGDTLYNDNRLEHILNDTNVYYPVEGGWWGVNYVPTSGSTPGTYILIQTSPCGIITSREVITLTLS